MELEDQVHVFRYGILGEPAGFNHTLAVKHREGSGDNQCSTQHVPTRPSIEKAAQIFDHLKTLDECFGQADPHHSSIAHLASVQYADNTTARHGIDGRADDGSH